MPSKFKSPFATSFTTAVKNGTPCSTVVWNISKKTNKPVNTIWNSLFKAGLCFRQKFNGTWVYWPSFQVKKNSTTSHTTQTTMWQNFVEWCVTNNFCTPSQLSKNSTTQKSFMNFCRKFFGKQFTATKRTTKRRRTTGVRTNWTTKHGKKRTTSTSTPWGRTFTRNYKFPTFKSRTNTRRYRRAA